MTDKEIDNRFMAMEMKLAYMEDFVNQIQEVAVEQAKTIDKLKGEINSKQKTCSLLINEKKIICRFIFNFRIDTAFRIRRRNGW